MASLANAQHSQPSTGTASNPLSAGGAFRLGELQHELSTAIEKEDRRQRVDDMKKRAIVSSGSYDEFRHLVACAEDNLSSLSRKELNSLGDSSLKKRSFGANSVAVGGGGGGAVGVDGSSVATKNKSRRRRRRRGRKAGPAASSEATDAAAVAAAEVSTAAAEAAVSASRTCGVPTSSDAFLRAWEPLVKHGVPATIRVAFLRRVGAASLVPRLFKWSLPFGLLSEICEALLDVCAPGSVSASASTSASSSSAAAATPVSEGDRAFATSFLRAAAGCEGHALNIEFFQTDKTSREIIVRLLAAVATEGEEEEEGGKDLGKLYGFPMDDQENKGKGGDS